MGMFLRSLEPLPLARLPTTCAVRVRGTSGKWGGVQDRLAVV